MTWHSETVLADGLTALLGTIRQAGGTITNCRPDTDQVQVTWTSAD